MSTTPSTHSCRPPWPDARCARRARRGVRRHAVTFVDSSSGALSNVGYGDQGLVVMYGGTTDPLSEDAFSLLDDLWVLDLAKRVW
jgi:hypothetical protein